MNIDHSYALHPPLILPHLADISTRQYTELAVEDEQGTVNHSHVFNVPGDGNCFFHCLSLNLWGSFRRSFGLRKSICEHVLQNWVIWKDRVWLCHGISDPRTYYLRMIQSNGYATTCEIQAASQVLRCTINVWFHGNSQDGTSRFTLQSSICTHPMALTLNLLLRNDHFQVIRYANEVNINGSTAQKSSSNDHTSNESHMCHGDLDDDHSYAKHPKYPKHSNTTCRNNKMSDSTNKRKYMSQSHTQSDQQSQNNAQHSSSHNSQTNSTFNCQSVSNKHKSEKAGNSASNLSSKTVQPNNQTDIHSSPEVQSVCQKLGVRYEGPARAESRQNTLNRRRRNKYKIMKQEQNFKSTSNQLSNAPPIQSHTEFNQAITVDPPGVSIHSANNESSETCNLQMNSSHEHIYTSQHGTSNALQADSSHLDSTSTFTSTSDEHHSENATNCASHVTSKSVNLNKQTHIHSSPEVQSMCQKLGVQYEGPASAESRQNTLNRRRRNKYKIMKREQKLGSAINQIPNAAPVQSDTQFNKAMTAIRSFELEQMNYSIRYCETCKERRIDMKMGTHEVCKRCQSDKQPVKMFSAENNMNPGIQPPELSTLTTVEQQLIS